jgi:hypothetical protein
VDLLCVRARMNALRDAVSRAWPRDDKTTRPPATRMARASVRFREPPALAQRQNSSPCLYLRARMAPARRPRGDDVADLGTPRRLAHGDRGQLRPALRTRPCPACARGRWCGPSRRADMCTSASPAHARCGSRSSATGLRQPRTAPSNARCTGRPRAASPGVCARPDVPEEERGPAGPADMRTRSARTAARSGRTWFSGRPGSPCIRRRSPCCRLGNGHQETAVAQLHRVADLRRRVDGENQPQI